MYQEIFMIYNSVFIQKSNQNKQNNKQTVSKTWLSKLGNVTTVTTIENLVTIRTHLKGREKLEEM